MQKLRQAKKCQQVRESKSAVERYCVYPEVQINRGSLPVSCESRLLPLRSVPEQIEFSESAVLKSCIVADMKQMRIGNQIRL